MANINLDFNSVPSREPLAEGVYVFEIKSVEEKVSSAGNDMWLVRFDEVESGTAVFDNYVLKSNCLWKLKELLDALGFETSANLDIDPQDLVGQVVKGKVIQEDYEGSPTNRMKKIYAA